MMVKVGLSLPLALKRGCPLPLKNAWNARDKCFKAALTILKESPVAKGNHHCS